MTKNIIAIIIIFCTQTYFFMKYKRCVQHELEKNERDYLIIYINFSISLFQYTWLCYLSHLNIHLAEEVKMLVSWKTEVSLQVIIIQLWFIFLLRGYKRNTRDCKSWNAETYTTVIKSGLHKSDYGYQMK